jgi:RimJ/RimL family protein N-acetyltransferase
MRELDGRDLLRLTELNREVFFARLRMKGPEGFLDDALDQQERHDRTLYAMGVTDHADTLVGCSIYDFDEPDGSEAEILAFFDPNFQARGVSHQAILAFLDTTKDSLPITALTATADPSNVRSRRSLEKMGFVETGFQAMSRYVDAAGNVAPRIHYRAELLRYFDAGQLLVDFAQAVPPHLAASATPLIIPRRRLAS